MHDSHDGGYKLDLDVWEFITNATQSDQPAMEMAQMDMATPPYDVFDMVTHGILVPMIGALGLLGNLLCILVLTRPQMKSSINTILVALVSCDSLVIVTSILMFVFRAFQFSQLNFVR